MKHHEAFRFPASGWSANGPWAKYLRNFLRNSSATWKPWFNPPWENHDTGGKDMKWPLTAIYPLVN